MKKIISVFLWSLFPALVAAQANVSVSGTIHHLNDPNNYLATLGWTSLAIGQGFQASYDIGTPSELSNQPSLNDGTAYNVSDPLANASIEIFGSGTGLVGTFAASGGGRCLDNCCG